MGYLIYKLLHVPDLSLAKYQALEDNNASGLINRHNAFLRQWHRISMLMGSRIHLFIRYQSDQQPGQRMNIFLVFSTKKEEILSNVDLLIQASPLADYYSMQRLPETNALNVLSGNYLHEAILQKVERERISDNATDTGVSKFYTVSGWEASDSARLYDMLRIMDSLQEDVMYVISLEGIDAFSITSAALEKPISYLRKKTSFSSQQMVNLGTQIKSTYRDVAAEDTLEQYEKLLSQVANSPCFSVNIRAFSQSAVGAEVLLAAATGEAIEEGDTKIVRCNTTEKIPDIIQRHTPFSSILPESLAFWPTMFTLEELSPFFRLPILLEGENIDMPKETENRNNSGGLQLGTDTKAHPVHFDVGLLKKHAFVCGVPGAGKTNTMLGLCYKLWNVYHIPFLALEPAKKEYRALARTDIEDLIIFSPSSGSKFPLAINPFQFPMNMSLAEHIQNLMEVFEGAFPLVPPLPALLDRSIEAVYLDHGWDTEDINIGELDYPTMSELYYKLEEELKKTDYDGEVRGNMKSALEMRIGSLLRRDLGNVFDVATSTIAPENWIKYPVIIELESLGKGPANFLTLMICTLIREVLRCDPNGDADKVVRHVMFIEEAHNLIAPESSDVTGENANPKAAATSYIVKMLAEVRALREGIIIADQLPTAMAPEILKNTTLKIAHRLTSTDDRSLVGSTMAASEVQLEELSTFLPGETLIYYEGLLKPFKLKVDMFPLKDPPNADELNELMQGRALHTKAVDMTIQSRLLKLQVQWLKEWKETTAVYDKLISDCNQFKNDAGGGDLKTALSTIMRDQVGMNACLDVLKALLKKYKKYAKQGYNIPKECFEFSEKAQSDIDAVTYYATKLLTEIRF